MTQERSTGTVVGLIVGLLFMMGGCGSEESSSTGGTGQVILKPPAGVFAAAALTDLTATLDIVGTSVSKFPMLVNRNANGIVSGVSAEVPGVPVGTWTFRITYLAGSVSGPVVVAEASGVGTVTANTITSVDLPWTRTNFYEDTDAATNLEEVIAVPATDPRNPENWPVLPVAVSAGGSHSLARKGDNTAWAWGSDKSGQLGDFQLSDFLSCISTAGICPRPVRVGKLPGVPDIGITFTIEEAVSAGMTHSLALKDDGTVWAWGSDGFGQLGDDTAFGGNKRTPVQVDITLGQ